MAGLDQDRDFVITNPHSSTCPVVCSLPRERGARRSRARNAARCGACCRPRRAGGVLGVWLLRLRDQVGQGGRQGRAGDTPSRGERVPTARYVGFGSVSGVGVGNWLRLGPFSEAAPTPPTTRHVAARGVSGWAPCGTAIAPSPRLHQQPKEVNLSSSDPVRLSCACSDDHPREAKQCQAPDEGERRHHRQGQRDVARDGRCGGPGGRKGRRHRAAHQRARVWLCASTAGAAQPDVPPRAQHVQHHRLRCAILRHDQDHAVYTQR